MIAFEGVTVSVAAPAGPHGSWTHKTLLADISCTLTERRVAVIGANGSGKSTLLRLVNGLTTPTSGRVVVDGLDVSARGREVRQRVGFVFTDPLSQLVAPTPLEDVELSLRRIVRDRASRRERARALLGDRGLGHLAGQSIYDLSGGERQLVALTAVLAVQPAVLVADEPTTLLDLRNRQRFRRVLADLPQQVVVATHDLELACDADRVIVVDDGRLSFDGPPADAVVHYERLMA